MRSALVEMWPAGLVGAPGLTSRCPPHPFCVWPPTRLLRHPSPRPSPAGTSHTWRSSPRCGLCRIWTRGGLLQTARRRRRRTTCPGEAPASGGPACRRKRRKKRRRRSAPRSSPYERRSPETKTPSRHDSAPGLIYPSRRREWTCCRGWETWPRSGRTK